MAGARINGSKIDEMILLYWAIVPNPSPPPDDNFCGQDDFLRLLRLTPRGDPFNQELHPHISKLISLLCGNRDERVELRI